MNDADDLLHAIRALSKPADVAALAARLGFAPVFDPAPADVLRACTPDDAVRLHVVGHRAGATAWLIVADDGAHGARAARALQQRDLACHALTFSVDAAVARLSLHVLAPDQQVRSLHIERADPRVSDADTLCEMVAAPGEGRVAIALRHARALDRTRVTARFFADFRGRRDALAAAWTGIAADARDDRARLALLLLCRLLFLYFLQRGGRLAGDPAYLPGLVRRWRSRPGTGSFYRAVLVPLFFGALNRRPEDRSAAARALGDLPYLNGGLFERHPAERRHRRLDLPDAALFPAFDDLLERYRFTVRERADALAGLPDASGIDPEMLGRVFEGLMPAARRGETGAFYTPAAAVDDLVCASLDAWLAPVVGSAAPRVVREPRASYGAPAAARALADARILDPACGSGAFLLGALARVARIRAAGEKRDEDEVRACVIAETLHGVDLDGDAALLCALRLWLALAPADPVRPLPNLDRRIRQGDSLIDPLDLAAGTHPPGPDVRRAIRTLRPLARRYLHCAPAARGPLRRRLRDCELRIARAWVDDLRRRLDRDIAELRARVDARDLFGEALPDADEARLRLQAVSSRREDVDALGERVRTADAVPFFSFPVHFADAGPFDLVLSNPPWVRSHRWPPEIAGLLRQRYRVGRRGWSAGARLAGAPVAAAAQLDLAMVFLERSIELLAPRGVLGILLPAKFLRSLYAGTGRRLVLERMRICRIVDHGLDQHAIFAADAFATSLVARRAGQPGQTDAGSPPLIPAGPGEDIDVTLSRRNGGPVRFRLPAGELPLFPDDPESPWLLAPDDARRALRRMQQAGPSLGTHPGLRVRRGVFTGANAVLLVREATPRLGDLAHIRAEGHARAKDGAAASFEAFVEAAQVRPIVRGADLDAWTFRTPRSVLWVHGEDGRPGPPGAWLDRYLRRHAAALGRRSGTARLGPGALLRVSADTLAGKVAWHDLAPTLRAVALPARIRSSLGLDGPLVPLNTVYFIPVADPDLGLLLAAVLNSGPVRTFARTIAERAKDQRFRFFAWTIAALPLPRGWRTAGVVADLLRLSRAAHADGGLDVNGQHRLDALVGCLYGLSPDHLSALADFGAWLDGAP